MANLSGPLPLEKAVANNVEEGMKAPSAAMRALPPSQRLADLLANLISCVRLLKKARQSRVAE